MAHYHVHTVQEGVVVNSTAHRTFESARRERWKRLSWQNEGPLAVSDEEYAERLRAQLFDEDSLDDALICGRPASLTRYEFHFDTCDDERTCVAYVELLQEEESRA